MVEGICDAFTDIFSSVTSSGDKSVLTINFSFSHNDCAWDSWRSSEAGEFCSICCTSSYQLITILFILGKEMSHTFWLQLIYALTWEPYVLVRPSYIISSKIRRLVSEDCRLRVESEDAQHQSLAGARILIRWSVTGIHTNSIPI